MAIYHQVEPLSEGMPLPGLIEKGFSVLKRAETTSKSRIDGYGHRALPRTRRTRPDGILGDEG
jgi:hypothetical protein